MVNKQFFAKKKVLITGNTGFKGTWMSYVLLDAGAEVVGYSLEPPTKINLYELSDISKYIKTINGDVRDCEKLKKIMNQEKPDIVIHMAAQPIVKEGYKNPVGTYETNVMGTVNVLESIRFTDSVRSFLNVTTDKVYENKEWEWGYRENENLNGYDPYSNSKSCSELITSCYKKSFFEDGQVAISTARAGNVIGGGDFAENRIIPDCVRAVENKTDIIVRNPYSIRPYQHVLESVMAYLMIAERQFNDANVQGSYNVGPNDIDCITTGELVEQFCNKWGNNLKWINRYDGGPHEAQFLKLDCSKLKKTFGWKPRWNVSEALDKTVEWSKEYIKGGNISKIMLEQINSYEEGKGSNEQ